MSRVDADIDALRRLREALLTFVNRQKEAMEAAEREINITLQMLDEAERYWRYQVEERQRSLEQCQREAAQAAAQGYGRDCSSYAYALREAEERLHLMQSWQRRVDETVAIYKRGMYQVTSLLDRDMSQARYFLDNRIRALEAYHATSVSSSTVGLDLAMSAVGTGIGVLAGMIGGVIKAVQGSQSALQHALGGVGEEVAVQVLSAKFGLQRSNDLSGTHGFEQVFNAPGMPLVVVEPQASKGGFEQVIEHRLAQLAQSLSAEDMPKVAVVTGLAKELADVYARRDNGSWQLLKSDVTLRELESSSPADLTIPPKRDE